MAQANERRFTHTYESAVLPAGAWELEPWVTLRAGRSSFYSRFDYRLEYEVGVTDRLLTAFYLNWNRITQADPANQGQSVTEQNFKGLSWELKYKVLDPSADPLGLALYQEYTVNSDEFEWESKLILDKRIGDNLIAYNAVAEAEWGLSPGEREYAVTLENVLGATHLFTPAFAAGLELKNPNLKTRTSTGLASSALFFGPVASYARKNWWLALTVLRQLPALQRSEGRPDDSLVLDTREKLNVRLIGALRF
ncbi:MAG: hypothetical protein HY926_06300 [Elusimicrobia bacterium]|nr:hypothetical protein [Elusimicrobiota bacterium]